MGSYLIFLTYSRTTGKENTLFIKAFWITLFVVHTCTHIWKPYVTASVYTHLADSSLQHSIQSSLRCVHVSGDALASDHTRKLTHISCHAQDVVEAVSWTTADLVITGRRQIQLREFFIATIKSVDLQRDREREKQTFPSTWISGWLLFLSPSMAQHHNNIVPWWSLSHTNLGATNRSNFLGCNFTKTLRTPHHSSRIRVNWNYFLTTACLHVPRCILHPCLIRFIIYVMKTWMLKNYQRGIFAELFDVLVKFSFDFLSIQMSTLHYFSY